MESPGDAQALGSGAAGMDGGGGGDWGWCINLWATPRSLSTTLMYSFAQRPDTEVVDEPLYAHYLSSTGAQHPLRQEVLASQGNKGQEVLQDVVFAPQRDNKLRFVKNMAKHCTQDIRGLALLRGWHVVLVREPLQVLASFNEVVPPSLDETGFLEALAIYSALSVPRSSPPHPSTASTQPSAPPAPNSHTPQPQTQQAPSMSPVLPSVVVVDARDLASNTEGTLRALCATLGIPFFPGMLRWDAGPRPEDGVWAPIWYQELHQSTGFKASPHPYSTLLKPQAQGRGLVVEDPFLYSLLEACHPLYSLLRSRAIRPLPTPPGDVDPELGPVEHPAPCLPVPANQRLLVWVGNSLLPRALAKVHVLDSIAQGGDGVWEGLRVYNGRIFKLQEHLDRLLDSAKALAFERVPSQEKIRSALVATLAANGMRSNAHVRLTLTRGLKVTSGMSPHFNQYGCTLIVLAEWKPPVYDNSKGITLLTASNRRNPAQCLDSKIHHNNLLNNILAKIEGNSGGADDAVMLDIHGFVSETNATNLFLVKKGVLLTPSTAHACLPGITRATVLEMARAEGVPVEEGSITPSQLHNADEVFTSGTMGELTPCVRIDSRPVGNGQVGPVTRHLQQVYAKRTASEGWELPAFSAAQSSLCP